MQKILITIFICIIVLLYDIRYKHTFASEHDMFSRLPELNYQEIPLLCSTGEILHNYLIDRKFIPKKSWNGRERASKYGEIVFIVVEYQNSKNPNEIIHTLTIPTGESCVVYHIFDEKTIKPLR